MVEGKVIAGIVIAAVILIGAYFFVSVEGVRQSGNSVKVIGTGSSVMQNEKTIEISDSGFSPNLKTISAGDTITFENKGSVPHWPISQVFNPKQALKPGESWQFTFYEKGIFGYYDNLNVSNAGKIIVK